MDKVVKSLKEAIILSGLQNGMTVSFHHHYRLGDTLVGRVMKLLSEMGFKDLRLAASGLNENNASLIEQIKDNTIGAIDTAYIPKSIGEALGRGCLNKPVIMRTHGGRVKAIESGELKIDVAFIAASCCDRRGNCTGVHGKSAFGSFGYAIADAHYARKVIVVTDNLSEDPVVPISINQSLVDYVVVVDSVGDNRYIQAKTTNISKDPTNLQIAKTTAQVIEHSGLLKDGFCYQAGAGGTSLAVTQYLQEVMLRKGIKGRFGLGGGSGPLVKMLEKGLFQVLYDVQCFDLQAVESIRKNPNHVEISASLYANPANKGCLVHDLDCVVLGATEIDVNFNVNVHTDSNNTIIGGSGGHGDAAFGAKMTIITAPSFRGRIPIVVDRVNTISTKGDYIDVLVTQHGVAVNQKNRDNQELAYRLRNAGINVIDIHDLKKKVIDITGEPNKIKKGSTVIAKVLSRDSALQDEIKNYAS